MKSQVTVQEAKTNLSRLIARVEAGEEIIIARRDKPVVKLVLVDEAAEDGCRDGQDEDTDGRNGAGEGIGVAPTRDHHDDRDPEHRATDARDRRADDELLGSRDGEEGSVASDH